jgi:hypothetical protein
MPKLAITGAELFPLSNELPTLGRTRLLAIPYPRVEKGGLTVIAFQEVPSDEVAIVLVASPTATHNDPFHATPHPISNRVVALIVQLVPFVELKIEARLPPTVLPTATHNDPFHATW